MHYPYVRQDFILQANDGPNRFDETLQQLWSHAHESGLFRYQLPEAHIRRIPDCPLNPVVLSLPERLRLRRKPTVVQTLNDPVSGFNFNQLPPGEVMFKLVGSEEQRFDSLLAINISPFAMLHSLFIPQPCKLFNQRLRKCALTAAIECFLLSCDRSLCMGFNSLLALASVNHLHFHLWRTPEPLYAMTAIPLRKPHLPKYLELPAHPVDNFTVELPRLEELDEFISAIWDIVEVCHHVEIAYNLFLCRNTEGYVRAVLWLRRSVSGAKPLEASIPIAVAELAGMIVIPDDGIETALTSDHVLNLLNMERLPVEVISMVNKNLMNG